MKSVQYADLMHSELRAVFRLKPEIKWRWPMLNDQRQKGSMASVVKKGSEGFLRLVREASAHFGKG